MKQANAQQTKEKLLHAAQQIIRDEGIQALSANKIIAVAGVSKGGFFHHFPTLESLYLYMLDDLTKNLNQNLTPESHPTLQDFLQTTTHYLLTFLETSPETISSLFYFMSQTRHKPDYQKRLKTMLSTSFKNWATKLSHYINPPPSNAELESLVRIMDMYFVGLSLHHLVMNDKAQYQKISNDFVAMIMLFIQARVSPQASSNA